MAAPTIQTILKPTRARGLDTSGNNNHAQIYSGRALEFDGVVDRFKNGTAVEGISKFADNKEWTFACWLYFSSTATGQIWYVGKDETTTQMFTKHSDETLRFRENDGTYHVIHATRKVEFNTWYRQVVICNGTTWAVYMNGEEWGTVTPTDTQMHFNGWGTPYETGGTWHYFMDGMMSDGQVWDKAWTADDVSYDYLNPEQLALNRGGNTVTGVGTQLTESNLKLWYPMNEGHRGNQSYVLDASNTGIGDDLVNWSSTFNASGTSTSNFGDWTTNANDSTTFCTFDHNNKTIRLRSTDGTHVQAFYSPNIMREGIMYKFEYTISELTSGSVRIRPKDNTDYIVHTEVGTYSYITTPADGDDLDFRIERNLHTGANDFTVSDIKVYPINDKYNATTVFYGDNLLPGVSGAALGDFEDSGNTPTFGVHYSGGSGDGGTYDADNTSSPLNGSKDAKFTNATGSGSEGAENAGIVSNGLDVVTGRTYVISFKYKTNYDASSQTNKLTYKLGETQSIGSNHIDTGGGYAGDSTLDATTSTTFTQTFVHTDSDTEIFLVLFGGDGLVFQIDDVSFQEVGIASGWTDADQQLDIPQTALQSYNQLAYFDERSSEIAVPDTNDLSFTNDSTDSPFSLSAWIYTSVTPSIGFFIMHKGGYSSYHKWEYTFFVNSARNLTFTCHDGATADSARNDSVFAGRRTNDAPIELGKWYHVVAAYDGGDNPHDDAKLYINGEEATHVSYSDGSYEFMKNQSIGFYMGKKGLSGSYGSEGCQTECSVWNKELSSDEVKELYNEGLALDCTTHSASANLVGYWKNSGITQWDDLSSNSNNGAISGVTETMLITAGVDSSRDSQGFLMNRQKTTNSLNLPTALGSATQDAYAVVPTGSGATPGDNINFIEKPFSFTCWVKVASLSGTHIIFDRGDGTDGFLLKCSSTGIPVFVVEDNNTEVNANGGSSNSGGLSSGTMAIGTWYFIAGTHEGVATSANMKLYVGTSSITPALIHTQPNGVELDSSGANLYLGSRYNNSLPYNGELDDLCFYDNDELDLTQITKNYNAGKRSHR